VFLFRRTHTPDPLFISHSITFSIWNDFIFSYYHFPITVFFLLWRRGWPIWWYRKIRLGEFQSLHYIIVQR
jgi:hypothetical protein